MRSKSFEIDGMLTADDVPLVRRFVERLHRSISTDVALLAMATHELLENAIKFSTDGTAFLRLEIVPGATATVTTRNRATPSNLEALDQIARDLSIAFDPMRYYLDQMRKGPDRVGGLGLGRVVAEADMKIEMLLEGDMVEIKAETRLDAGV